jgi:hypothetical protein
MRFLPAIAFATFLSSNVWAYDYGEHKEIGDRAFQRFARALNERESFLLAVDVKQDEHGLYYFAGIPAPGGIRVSYGVLNGLSGDHMANPLELEQLNSADSVLWRIISLHEQYLRMGYAEAPDAKLARLDFNYALLAVTNLSHFYEYGKTFQQQLRAFNEETVRRCENPDSMESAFRQLGRTNALNTYATLHAAAIDLAEQSGKSAATGGENAGALLRYAFVMNAFADHFLEDSFSAGHLLVNRSVHAAFTNNKALHDFYSENGTTVLNRSGEIWTAYGDGKFDGGPENWNRGGEFQDTPPVPYSEEAERVIGAVEASLRDVWNGFAQSRDRTEYEPFLRRMPKDDAANFLIRSFPALSLVPVPYHSDLSTLFEPSAITQPMKEADQTPPYRNFIRSRVGNSFVMGVARGLDSGRNIVNGAELRFNAGNLGHHYSNNARGGKKGTVDRWLGYTLNYTGGTIQNWNGTGRTVPMHQVLGGVRSNLDWWLTDKKFVGIYGYTEAGIEVVNRKAAFVFAPSIGLQLGSLVHLNYYNMPAWLRIPLEYFLPLKVRYGAAVPVHQSPRYFTSFEMDFVF